MNKIKENLQIFIFIFCAIGLTILYHMSNLNIGERYIRENAEPKLFTLINNIDNSINEKITKEELTFEAYYFASAIENLIVTLNHKNVAFKSISITPNFCPSTVWRVNNTEQSYDFLKDKPLFIRDFIKQRRNAVIKQSKFHNNIVIVDYNENSDCDNQHILFENQERYDNLILKTHSHEATHGLSYGIYWILKFEKDNNYYIFSSPLSYQADSFSDNQIGIHASNRKFIIKSKKAFENSTFYFYLKNRSLTHLM
jgi:hypothetical protein